MTDSFKMKVKIVQTSEVIVELHSRQYHIEEKEHMLKCERKMADDFGSEYLDSFEDIKTTTVIEQIKDE